MKQKCNFYSIGPKTGTLVAPSFMKSTEHGLTEYQKIVSQILPLDHMAAPTNAIHKMTFNGIKDTPSFAAFEFPRQSQGFLFNTRGQHFTELVLHL